jgi:hypothetical protein
LAGDLGLETVVWPAAVWALLGGLSSGLQAILGRRHEFGGLAVGAWTAACLSPGPVEPAWLLASSLALWLGWSRGARPAGVAAVLGVSLALSLAHLRLKLPLGAAASGMVAAGLSLAAWRALEPPAPLIRRRVPVQGADQD